jgi:hypothetical protein
LKRPGGYREEVLNLTAFAGRKLKSPDDFEIPPRTGSKVNDDLQFSHLANEFFDHVRTVCLRLVGKFA